jgi:hypothetical protein
MNLGTLTVADLESDLQNALGFLVELDQRGRLPEELRPLLLLAPAEGASVHVSLRHRDQGRQIRRTFGGNAFNQRECGAWIVFESPRLADPRHGDREQFDRRPRDDDRRDHDSRRGHESQHEMRGQDHEEAYAEFIRALNRAESEPQLTFVSLKWFRDTYLVKGGYDWAYEPDLPRQFLSDAAERNMVLTSKVPNPKQPEFPVTSIHLNREHPDVQRILGDDRG